MKFFLIHGDDTGKSYNRLQKFISEAKKRNWEIIYLDNSTAPFKENMSGTSLFGGTRFYVHRDIKNLSKGELQFLIKNKDKFEGNVVLFSGTTIPKTLINEFPKDAILEEFKLPMVIWSFLDSIYPGNVKTAVKMLHEILIKDPAEKVLGLLAWHMRDLYLSKVAEDSGRSLSYRGGKLKTQAAKFRTGQLENFIEELAEIDIKSKTSQEDLTKLLDFAFITKLQ